MSTRPHPYDRWLSTTVHRIAEYLGLGGWRSIGAVLAIGLVIRLAVAPLSGHAWDTYVWWFTGQQLIAGKGLYAGQFMYSYPPVWGGFIYLATIVYQPVASGLGLHPIAGSAADFILGTNGNLGAPEIPNWLFVLLIKIPLIIGDVLTTLLIFRVVSVRLGRPALAKVAATVFFLNPYVILISSVWGQFDILATYMAFLGLLLFLDKKPVLAGSVLGIGIATKFFPAVVLLLLVVVYLDLKRPQPVLKTVGAAVASLAVISLPFLLTGPSVYVHGVLSPASASSATGGGLTVWGVLLSWTGTHLPAWGVPADLILIFSMLVLLGISARVGPQGRNVFLFWFEVNVAALLVFLVLLLTVSDQYLVWVIPLLTILVVFGRTSKLIYWSLSGVVVAHAILSQVGTTMFIPSLSISPSFGRVFPILVRTSLVGNALGVVSWLLMVLLLVTTLSGLWGSPLPARNRIAAAQ